MTSPRLIVPPSLQPLLWLAVPSSISHGSIDIESQTDLLFKQRGHFEDRSIIKHININKVFFKKKICSHPMKLYKWSLISHP